MVGWPSAYLLPPGPPQPLLGPRWKVTADQAATSDAGSYGDDRAGHNNYQLNTGPGQAAQEYFQDTTAPPSFNSFPEPDRIEPNIQEYVYFVPNPEAGNDDPYKFTPSETDTTELLPTTQEHSAEELGHFNQGQDYHSEILSNHIKQEIEQIAELEHFAEQFSKLEHIPEFEQISALVEHMSVHEHMSALQHVSEQEHMSVPEHMSGLERFSELDQPSELEPFSEVTSAVDLAYSVQPSARPSPSPFPALNKAALAQLTELQLNNLIDLLSPASLHHSGSSPPADPAPPSGRASKSLRPPVGSRRKDRHPPVYRLDSRNRKPVSEILQEPPG